MQEPRYRHALPQLAAGVHLTDGGMETTLIFHRGLDLPHFAAFTLLEDEGGRDALRAYYDSYLAIADRHGCAIVLDTATWRANPDWGAALGYAPDALAAANTAAVALLAEVRAARAAAAPPLVINGAIGPRGDGYAASTSMSVEEAADYHAFQVDVFGATAADMVTALTMTYAEEAAGIARAAAAASIPVAISFTVETDGRLPSGQPLAEAIEQVDAATDGTPVYHMINCAHPSHFESRLGGKSRWISRIRGIRANASRRSHAELNEAPDLDDGNPEELGGEYRAILKRYPHISVVGGCCGTDHRHVEQICRACTLA
jgi:homocysteine S-methyltransferase